MSLSTSQWQYLYGKPQSQGQLKTQLADFQVQEVLGYEPSGEGEHCYLWLRKTQLNTAFVAEQLAAFAKVPLRAVTYAGRKDKYAVTEQWFGVHLPGKIEPDWSQFSLQGAEILNHSRHNKKLRTGALKGNRFNLIIRNLQADATLENRLTSISQHGVPNYFGDQRFGNEGGNLYLANRMLDGETIRNRNKRSMAISALRSWLFNEMVSARIANGNYRTILLGDAMQLFGSNSFFIQDEAIDASLERLKTGDINITAPLWGAGNLPSKHTAESFEKDIAEANIGVCDGLAALGLKQERRSVHLQPRDMQWQISNDTLNISFELPSGSFATSVMREIIQPISPEQDNEIIAE